VGDEFNVGANSDILLNDVPIGQSIIDGGLTNGSYCNPYPGATKEWSVNPDILAQGENLVRIESGMRPNGEPDEWGMANVHLVLEGSNLRATEFEDFVFTSSYDGSSQPAALQVPTSYDPGQPTPLLIAVHGWGDDRWAALGSFAFEANDAGWLLAAPDMHGERSAYPRPPYDHPLASRASQHDILDTIDYVRERYNVDPSRIYLAGVSLGGQIALVTAAKNPGLFAAVVSDRGPTDLALWYEEAPEWRQALIAQECGGPPESGTWFEYQRRSPINYARNLTHTPLHLYHGTDDTVVLPHHSQDMVDAILSYDSTAPVTLTTFLGGHDTPVPGGNADIVQWLGSHELGQVPFQIDAITDESTTFWWAQITQQGSTERWTELQGNLQSSSRLIIALNDPGGIDLTANLALLNLPQAIPYVSEILAIDQAEFSAESVTSSQGRITVGLGGGKHQVTLYPGQEPVPMATLILQEGVSGYNGTADTTLSLWAPDGVYGNDSRIKLRAPNTFNGLLRFDLSGVPDTPRVTGIRGAALSVHVLSSSNSNTSQVEGYQVNRAWDENEATWLQASSTQYWSQVGANGVPGDRQNTAVDDRMFETTDLRLGLDVTDLVVGWIADPASNLGIVLRSEGDAVQYDVASSEHSNVGLRPRLLVVYPLATTTSTATPTPTPTSTATPTPTPTATAVPETGRIQGLVWADNNENQIRDFDEPGLAGAQVALWQSTQLSRTTTASDGSFAFADLAPGLYLVRETDPHAYRSTTDNDRTIQVGSASVVQVDFGDVYSPPPVRLPLLLRGY
jgi:predicted esterase